ncbi:MAG: P1 family peptidase [Dehalococcoidia bacterium]|nr:P1 family peptidase [Dehalococcoidia bacterium]
MGTRPWVSGPLDAITDVKGIRVGHWSDRRAATGCTVVLCEESALAAVDVRGGAPGTRETDTLNGANVVRKAHAILLTGGSAFGLGAAQGVMRRLVERDIGFPTTGGKVPIVPAAVLFDLAVGKKGAFPGEAEGYAAAKRAKGGTVAQGSAGAGTGATVAKLLGAERCMKGGIGTASVTGPRGLMVGALAVTNAVGAIFDPDTGKMIAGPRGDEPGVFVPLSEAIHLHSERADTLIENTTLVVVATNATLEHGQLQRLAYQGHDGMARALVPAHTHGDGDIVFAVSMAQVEAQEGDPLALGLMTVRAVERAIVKSVQAATSVAGVPALGG